MTVAFAQPTAAIQIVTNCSSLIINADGSLGGFSGGLSIKRLKVRQREKLGLRYVTDDRRGEVTVGPLSVGLNLVLKRIGQVRRQQRSMIDHRISRGQRLIA